MSWGRFNLHQSPTQSGAQRRSTPKPAPCNFVVIDEDDDGGDGGSDSEVYIIDGAVAAAAGEAAPAATGTKKWDGCSSNVIDIDDDEDEWVKEDTGRGDKAGPSMFYAASSPESMTPGRGSPRNRYGLDCTSDSYGSDSSEGWAADSNNGVSSDCEILDDTSGTAREMWESAASRKKTPPDVHKFKYGRATAFTSNAEFGTQPDTNANDFFSTECDIDVNFFRRFSDTCKGGEQNSTGYGKNEHVPSSGSNAKECSNGQETGYVQNSNGKANDGPAECHLNENMFQCFSDMNKEGAQNCDDAQNCHSPSSVPNTNKFSKGNVSNGKGKNCHASLDPDTSCNHKTAHSHIGVTPKNAAEEIQSPGLDETFAYCFVSANRVFPTRSSADRKEESPPVSVRTPEKADEKIPDGAYTQKDQSPPDDNNITNKDKYSAQDDVSLSGQQEEIPPSTSRSDCSRQFGESCPQAQDNSCACAVASINNTCVNFTQGSGSLPRIDSLDAPKESGQDDLIGEREKHKESLEFKQAAKEEWAARQRQLQIQAEEAKKLRKRKKAEAQRLFDMEKRQKQRLQEVRESQRKVEEDIQLKEQYRGVIRKELDDTERRYKDMASILRVLGIHVEGGEVKAAYKQALLKFHPDRVSRNDIYQQVKAEETFKFISRLKEKLPRFC